MRRLRHGRYLFTAIAALALSASGVLAASSALTGPLIGSGQVAVTAPCASITAAMSPSYDATDMAYESNSVLVSANCGQAGVYRLSVAAQTGASSYVEHTQDLIVVTAGPVSTTVTLPSKVKASDLVNIAVMIVPKP